jgi:hypothetical protein
MKRNKILLLFLFNSTLLFAQAPPISWQKCLGGSGADFSKDIKYTTDGGCIVVGDVQSTDGDVIGSHGGYDAWVVKLSSSGNIQWQKPMGGGGADGFRSVEQTTDGGYILLGEAGSFDGDVSGINGASDFWLVKLDNAGNMQWQKCLGGSSDDIGYCVHQTTDGGYILSGETASLDGDVTGNHGNPGTKDVWVVKTDGTGNIQWQKNFGTTGNDVGNFISPTSDGGYILAAAGDRIDGDLLCSLHGGYDNWIIKLDGMGNVQWQKCLGGVGSESPNCIRENADGTFIILSFTNFGSGDVVGWHAPAGGFPNDYWVVKLTSTGNIIWQKCLGGTGSDMPSYSIVQTTDGGYIVAGWTSSTNGDVSGLHGGEDYWIVKLDANANIQWQHCYGGTSIDDCLSIQTTSDGGYVMVGTSFSNDGDVSGNHGLYDLWVVRLGGVVLPVSLVSFIAEQTPSGTDLKWQTASEQNTDFFSIEKSIDGRSFVSIGKIAASGNSQSLKNYHFRDSTIAKITTYYRLKQVDIDRQSTYSTIVKISKTIPVGGILISPNPAKHFINVNYSGKKEMVDVFIYDNTGRLITKNWLKNEPLIRIETGWLHRGMYLISISDGTTVQEGKFFKE